MADTVTGIMSSYEIPEARRAGIKRRRFLIASNESSIESPEGFHASYRLFEVFVEFRVSFSFYILLLGFVCVRALVVALRIHFLIEVSANHGWC